MSETSMDDHDTAGRKRQKPPVIELSATDLTPESPKPEGGESPPSQASAKPARDAGPPHQLLAGLIGLLTGALALALVFLFLRGGSLADIVGRTDPALAALSERVDQLLKLTAEQEKRLAAVESRPVPPVVDLAPLAARVEAMENSLSDLRKLGEQADARSATAIEALNSRLTALENRLTAPSRVVPQNSAQIVALGALRDAIVAGAPFAKELAAVHALLGERAAALAPFESSAAEGLPTIPKLAARFAALAPKLSREPEPEGYFARLWANVTHLVEVRPVGEVEGTSAGAIVARMEARLQRGDLAAALDEATRLPDAAKSVAADWLAVATRRRDAEIAVKNLLAAELAALAVEPAQ
jgi:hypothetical protein